MPQCNKENSAPSIVHQMQQRQQQALHNGQVKKQKFMWLDDQLPCKKPALGDQTATAKLAASAPEKATAFVSANPRHSSTTHKAASGSGSSAGGHGVQSEAGVRRSGRRRTQAVWQGYVSSTFIPSDSGSESESESDSDTDSHGGSESEADAVPIGSAHQACLPQLKQRPASGPTAAEAKFLSRPVYSPGSQPLQQQHGNPGLALAPGQFNAMWEAAGSGPARLELLKSWVDQMDAHVGQHTAQSLGLSLLGYKLKATWAPHEELLFALSMLDRYRMFRHMKCCYLPKRSVHELNSYYHNVWKPRAGDVAEEYAQLCEQNGDPVKLRLELCKMLAAIWDPSTMGPMPNSAALPPGTAAAALSGATGRTANAAGAASVRAKATTSTSVATAAQGGDAAKPVAASCAPVTVQTTEPPLLVADATAQVVATARTAQKQSKLAVDALQPVHASSRHRGDNLSPETLPIAGRRMALGLQQVRPVDTDAAGSRDTQRQNSVLCAKSPAGTPGVVAMSALQLPAAEGPQAMSHAVSGQQQLQCSWRSPWRVGQQVQSAQHPQQQEKQQQRALLPFPAGPTLQQNLPPSAGLHMQRRQQQQQQLAVQVTPAKPAASSLQQPQQLELLPPGPAMQTPATDVAAGAWQPDSTARPSCPDHSGSRGGCNQGSAQSGGGGSPQPDCQAQNEDAKQRSGTPQPGCQDHMETGWPCISLLGSQSGVDSPESSGPDHMRKLNSSSHKVSAKAAAVSDSHRRCLLADDAGDVICISN